MKGLIHVTLKNGVLDPQGSAIKKTLNQQGVNEVVDITQGKYFEVELDVSNKTQAEELLEKICKDLLANLVIENYKIQIIA